MTKDLIKLLKPLKRVVNESFFVLTNDASLPNPELTGIIISNLCVNWICPI